MKRFKTIFLITTLFSTISQRQFFGQTMFATSPDSVQIAYEIHGDKAPTLVFVHGWSCDRSYWKEQLEALAGNYKVVAIDLAGHGESGLSRRSWTIEAFGADIVTVIKKLGLKNVIMIGHSMGACVIAEAARQLPRDIVAGLVFVDQYKQLHTPRTPEEIQAFATRLEKKFSDSVAAFVRRMFHPKSDSSLVERVAMDMSSAPPAVALAAFRSTWAYSNQITNTLEELKLPVIFINSDNRPTDTASIERYGVQVMIMPGVGHFLMMEDPERFNVLLKTAIGKIVR
ncbi:MAG TPA: alpha/beta hydrolase [Chitinophagaceae bacterium]|nr:alpha/beta hydrolase [Chitinophagaceae bacterium]